MREICTSGSTRGGALRSPPTLPANSVLSLDSGSFEHQAQAQYRRANLSIQFFHLAASLCTNQCLRPFLD